MTEVGPSSAARRASSRLEELKRTLEGVDDALTLDEWLEVRSKMGVLLARFTEANTEIDRLLGATGAQGRILRYLRLHLGQQVTKEELSGVAGISEWARRVRELREDHGWVIHTATTRDGLAVGEYVLVLDQPEPALAEAWARAREARKLRTAGGAVLPPRRVLEFLKLIYPRSADRELLAHVAGSPKAAQAAIGKLREEGWPIARCDDDDPMAPGGSRLEALERDA